MRRCTVRAVALAGMSCTLALTRNAGAQESDDNQRLPTKVAVSVVAYRVGFVDWATPFEPCSLFKVMAHPEDLPGAFPPGFRPMLGVSDSLKVSCHRLRAQPHVPGQGGSPARVVFDSVSIRGSAAAVYTTVFRGDVLYREKYTLALLPRGDWGVESMLMFGALRIH